MAVELTVEMTVPDLGKGHVRITAEGIPNDLFVPLAISKLGKDDERMTKLFQQILSSYSYDGEDDDESEDENR
jgi:hypothetical protein